MNSKIISYERAVFNVSTSILQRIKLSSAQWLGDLQTGRVGVFVTVRQQQTGPASVASVPDCGGRHQRRRTFGLLPMCLARLTSAGSIFGSRSEPAGRSARRLRRNRSRDRPADRVFWFWSDHASSEMVSAGQTRSRLEGLIDVVKCLCTRWFDLSV